MEIPQEFYSTKGVGGTLSQNSYKLLRTYQKLYKYKGEPYWFSSLLDPLLHKQRQKKDIFIQRLIYEIFKLSKYLGCMIFFLFNIFYHSIGNFKLT